MIAAVTAVGCGDSGAGPVDGLDAGRDGAMLEEAGPDDAGEADGSTGLDAGGPDAAPPPDGGHDAGVEPDAGEPDAGDPCECSSGPCCDGCYFRPGSYRCATEVVYSARCLFASDACPGYHDRIDEEIGDIYCPGDAATCTGEVDHVRSVSRNCWTAEMHFFCEGEDGSATCTHVCE